MHPLSRPPPDGAAGPIRQLERPDSRIPLLVTGRSGSAILSGAAEFTYACETRGSVMDWGGVYGQGVRLTGPWTVRLETGRGSATLPETLVGLRAFRTHLESEHRTPDLAIRQLVLPLDALPGVARRLDFVARDGGPVQVRLVSEVVPFLAPVMMEGIKPYDYRLRSRRGRVSVRSHGFGFRLETDPAPDSLALDGTTVRVGRRAGELGRIATEHRFAVSPDRPVSVEAIVWGGLERTVASQLDAGGGELARTRLGAERAEANYRAWFDATPDLAFPDAPELEGAYALARGALRSLYYAPGDDLTGLVAGYPWYGALWCRDLAWMLPAVIWLGDFAWAERSLRCVFRFQAPARLPILAAEAGELPMQISPGPIFLYGTSDTTLYYPGIVRRLFSHSADLALGRELYPRLERVAAWARAKVHQNTGLVVNGGEIQAMRDASTAVGRVQYGFEAPDTTIWDSTDRRDHAIDIQALWYEALGALDGMAAHLDRLPAASPYADDARALRAAIRGRYRWPEEEYLYDSLRIDGSPVPKIRPNALRAVSVGIVTGDEARRIVRRAAREDLSTDWGVRTLAASDPGYDPIAYHDGQVWPIATAWAADAALVAGEADLGLSYLDTIARGFAREAGLAHECYRGDRAEPFDSCFLLGFSVAPFLTTLFDSLWGLTPRAERGAIGIRPRFPASWTDARVERLRLGNGTLSLRYAPGEVRARWSGAQPLLLEGDLENRSVPPGGEGRLELPLAPAQPS